MKTINLLISKLYYNGNYGIKSPSIVKFYISKISVSLIVLLWFYVLIYFLRIVFNIGLENSFTWFYIFVFLIFFYFLNKYTWTLNQVEEFINDKENEETLNKMMWIFWAMLIIPTLFFILIFKQ